MSDFALESPAPKTALPKVCGNCAHYQPHRDLATKRIHPSKKGHCGWQMAYIVWPMSVRIGAGSYGREQDPMQPLRVKVGSWQNAETCKCFQPKHP